MMSSRFLPIVCAIVGLALVPTFIHSYADFAVHDGLVTGAIPTSLSGYVGTDSGRNKTWGKHKFDSDDWTERIYRMAGDEVKLSVIRSYDAKSLYHHPELAVSYGPSYVRSEVRRFPRRPGIPVHMVYTGRDEGTVAMYALLFDDGFVEDPIMFQIRSAGELLFSRRQAMTLFFVTDEHVPASASIDTLPSAGLLFAAIDQFRAGGHSAP